MLGQPKSAGIYLLRNTDHSIERIYGHGFYYAKQGVIIWYCKDCGELHSSVFLDTDNESTLFDMYKAKYPSEHYTYALFCHKFFEKNIDLPRDELLSRLKKETPSAYIEPEMMNDISLGSHINNVISRLD